MATFEIAIFQTTELYNHCLDEFGYGYGYEAAYTAKDIIEGAFSRTPTNSANVTVASEVIGAPTEDPSCGNTVHAYHPCDDCECYYMSEFKDLKHWWKTWLYDSDCKDPHTLAQDSNILLTDYSGGAGCGTWKDNDHCVVGKMFETAKAWDQYHEYGIGSPAHGAKTTLHELGHNLLDSKSNISEGDDYGEDDGESHDYATVNSHWHDPAGEYVDTITPTGVKGKYNNCGYYSHKDTWDRDTDNDGFDLKYSVCANEKMDANK